MVTRDSQSGEQTLRDLLAASQDENIEKKLNTEQTISPAHGIWVDGIGEGRNEEDFISAYIRFSEGADEEESSDWQTNGVTDLTLHAHKAILYGSETMNLELSTCGVDEGELGKVKQPYDLVFESCDRETARGIAIDVTRGDSLDLAVLHEFHNDSRRKCTIEMWFNSGDGSVNDEVVLMRRSLSSEGIDLSKLCTPSYSAGILWELILLTNGHLEFRTPRTQLSSSNRKDLPDENVVTWLDEDSGTSGWNHVALVLSSESSVDLTSCNVDVYIKGLSVLSGMVQFSVPNGGDMDNIMKKTALLFGLGAFPGFRISELRVWSCARNKDDVKQNMYEYLSIAEKKSKFRFRIKNKKGLGNSGLSSPSRATLKPAPTLRLQSPRSPMKSSDKSTVSSMNFGHGFDNDSFENNMVSDDTTQLHKAFEVDTDKIGGANFSDSFGNFEEFGEGRIDTKNNVDAFESKSHAFLLTSSDVFENRGISRKDEDASSFGSENIDEKVTTGINDTHNDFFGSTKVENQISEGNDLFADYESSAKVNDEKFHSVNNIDANYQVKDTKEKSSDFGAKDAEDMKNEDKKMTSFFPSNQFESLSTGKAKFFEDDDRGDTSFEETYGSIGLKENDVNRKASSLDIEQLFDGEQEENFFETKYLKKSSFGKLDYSCASCLKHKSCT